MMGRPIPAAIFVCLCACASAGPAAAQAAGGIKLGLLFSDFHSGGDDPEVQALGVRPDVAFGGFLVVPAASPAALQLEAVYGRRGARLESGAERIDFRLAYLDFSGLVRATLGSGSVRPYLLGGATVGYRLAAETVRSEAGAGEETVDIEDSIQRTDLRIVAGLGIEAGHLLLEGRYSHGLRNVGSDPRASPATRTLKNRAFECLLGVRF